MLVEILDGIDGCLIYIKSAEYFPENAAIQNILKNPHKIYKENEYTIIRANKIFETPETSSLEMQLNSELEENMVRLLKTVVCPCRCTAVENESVLRLPADGWEELIDMWSCHCREFAHLAEQDIKPKKNGVLYSTLYLVIENERVPKCIRSSMECGKKNDQQMYTKVFYNQITTGMPDEYFLFYYLYDALQTRQEIEVVGEHRTYNIRLLDITYIYHGETTDSPIFNLSLKLAYKEVPSDKNQQASLPYINKYYTETLISLLHKNRISIEMNKRTVSFISKIL
ncbi:hypothetical protein NERG_01418 [Nematocida ausubeli]|uniref:Uncharacterized protein n=1 Tax=Nematocida ausubeli (strain ATCC PRA-371 / ERTm2) TaxID=1913371 RepID=H8ZCH5_NEMA1|nr:hypothetical protein NERG_01418 [Nematocida ausubeli]